MLAKEAKKLSEDRGNKYFTKYTNKINKSIKKAADNGQVSIRLYDVVVPYVIRKHYEQDGYKVDVVVREVLDWSGKFTYVEDTVISWKDTVC